MREPKLYLKIALNFLAAILLLLGIIFLAPPLLRFFMPFVIAWIIASIANPLVNFMEKKIKIVRKHSSAIIIILALAAVIGLLYWGISLLFHELVQFLEDLPALYDKMELAFKELSVKLEGIYRLLPDKVKGISDTISDSIDLYLSNTMKNMETPTISDASMILKNTAEILFVSVITILSAYFFIAERENISVIIKKNAPQALLLHYEMIVRHFKKAVGGYFKAQFKIMLIITAILFAGFEILRVDYSFLLALAVAFLDLLPVFGTGAVIWPWALVDLVMGNYTRVIGLMIIYFVCQVVKQLLQPKMVGDSVGITPLQTLVFMFIGYRIAGLLGLIIGIPMGMVLISFYKTGVFAPLIKGTKIIAKDLSEFIKF